MHETLIDVLRCPYCGTRLALVDTGATRRDGAYVEEGVLGCECCAYPIVAGIPVLVADETTRDAMHALEAGRREEALFRLLGLDEAPRAAAFRALLARGDRPAYRDALAILSRDAESLCFLYRFSDPTYLVAEAILLAIAQQPWTLAGRCLDVCGGSGHLTRVLTGLQPAGGTVVADVYFWKLWLATRSVAPGCAPVCCDANHPLPFARDSFPLVVLADSFPYIWHKRLLAEELMRLAGPGGVVAMPHLHSALGENYSAGDTLTPAAYRDLFAPLEPRLFSDRELFEGVVAGTADAGRRAPRIVDLARAVPPGDLDGEPSLTLVASRREELFRRYEIPYSTAVAGELIVNPLYRVERQGRRSVLSLEFPTPEYADEFRECRRYLPDALTLDGDFTGALDAASLGSDFDDLRRRRVILDAPRRY